MNDWFLDICREDPDTANRIADAIMTPARRGPLLGRPLKETPARIRGYELAELRKVAGLTQKEVAGLMGVSQARVSQIEHGQVDSLDNLRAYAAAIGGEVEVTDRQGSGRSRWLDRPLRPYRLNSTGPPSRIRRPGPSSGGRWTSGGRRPG